MNTGSMAESDQEDLFDMTGFSVLDECGSDEDDAGGSPYEENVQSEIQIIDDIASETTSKDLNFSEDLVLVDFDSSPKKDSQSYRSSSKERSRKSDHKSSRSRRSSSREKVKSRHRDTSNRSNSSRNHGSDRRSFRNKRSRSRESRHRTRSEKNLKQRERGGSNSQKNTPSKGRQITNNESDKESERSSSKKTASKLSAVVQEPNEMKTAKDELAGKTDRKSECYSEKVTRKDDSDNESEGEGFTISADDDLLSCIEKSRSLIADMVTVDEIEEKDNAFPEDLVTLNFTDGTKSPEKDLLESENVLIRKLQEKKGSNINKQEDKITVHKKSELDNLVVVTDFDAEEQKCNSKSSTIVDPSLFKVTEELVAVSEINMNEPDIPNDNAPSKIKDNEIKESLKDKTVKEALELVEVAEDLEKNDVEIVSVEESEMNQKANKDLKKKEVETEEKFYEVQEIDEEQMEIKIIEDIDISNKEAELENLVVIDSDDDDQEVQNLPVEDLSVVTDSVDEEDVIEIVFSNEDDEADDTLHSEKQPEIKEITDIKVSVESKNILKVDDMNTAQKLAEEKSDSDKFANDKPETHVSVANVQLIAHQNDLDTKENNEILLDMKMRDESLIECNSTTETSSYIEENKNLMNVDTGMKCKTITDVDLKFSTSTDNANPDEETCEVSITDVITKSNAVLGTPQRTVEKMIATDNGSVVHEGTLMEESAKTEETHQCTAKDGEGIYIIDITDSDSDDTEASKTTETNHIPSSESISEEVPSESKLKDSLHEVKDDNETNDNETKDNDISQATLIPQREEISDHSVLKDEDEQKRITPQLNNVEEPDKNSDEGDDFGEIDEEAFMAMMANEGLVVDEYIDSDEGTERKDSNIIDTESGNSLNKEKQEERKEKSFVKESKSERTSKGRSERDSSHSNRRSGSRSHRDHRSRERSSRERHSREGTHQERDRLSREKRDKGKFKDERSSEKDPHRRNVSKGKEQTTRKNEKIKTEHKTTDVDGSKPVADKVELPNQPFVDSVDLLKQQSAEVPQNDDYFEEELISIDEFYDEGKKPNVAVHITKEDIPKKQTHWGSDTVGEVLKCPMKVNRICIEDLEGKTAIEMLDMFGSFFVDLSEGGEGSLYVDNSDVKHIQPFVMIGKIAKFLHECKHLELECERPVAFLIEEKMKTIGKKKKEQVPKSGLLFIHAVPKAATEKSLKSIFEGCTEVMIPKNYQEKRVGFAMIVFPTMAEVKLILAKKKIFNRTSVTYKEIVKLQKGGVLPKINALPEEDKDKDLSREQQIENLVRRERAREELMKLQDLIMQKNKEKIKKTSNKDKMKKLKKKKEDELRNLMNKAKKIMAKEGIDFPDKNASDLVKTPEKKKKGRSIEDHEKLRSPLKKAEADRNTSGIVSIEANTNDAEYNRLRKEALEELKEDISSGKFKDQKHLENAISNKIRYIQAAERRNSGMKMWGSGSNLTHSTKPLEISNADNIFVANQFKEDFRKTRIPVQSVPVPYPGMIPESVEIMIPVPEGSNLSNQTPPVSLPGVAPQISANLPVQIPSVPANLRGHVPQVQQLPNPKPVLVAHQNIPRVPAVSLPTSTPVLHAQQVLPRIPIVSVASVQQPVPILPGAISVPQSLQQTLPVQRMPVVQPGYSYPWSQTTQTLVSTSATVPLQTRPALVSYPVGVPPRPVPPVPRVVAPTIPAVIQSKPVIYKPATQTPVTSSESAPKKDQQTTSKAVTSQANKGNESVTKAPEKGKKTELVSKPSAKEKATPIKINVGNQFSKRSAELLGKRKLQEDIDGVPFENTQNKKNKKSEEVQPVKSILRKPEPQAKIDIFEKPIMNTTSKTVTSVSDKQYKMQGNLLCVPLQKTNVSQSQEMNVSQSQKTNASQNWKSVSSPSSSSLESRAKQIEVLQGGIAKKVQHNPASSDSDPSVSEQMGNVSPQTLSYLKKVKEKQQNIVNTMSSDSEEDDTADLIQRLKGPEGLMSLMDVKMSGPTTNKKGISDMLKRWDYLSEKLKLDRERERLERKEAKLKKMMMKAPVLTKEFEEDKRKRTEKKKLQRNDPLIQLLQSALEAAQEKAAAQDDSDDDQDKSDYEDQDMSLSDEEEDPKTGEFIIDYGHKSLSSGSSKGKKKLSRRERKKLRMEQKKAEAEYRNKIAMGASKDDSATTGKESQDQLTELLKSSLSAVQEHLVEMKKHQSPNLPPQDPFIQDLMTRVSSHIQSQRQESAKQNITNSQEHSPTVSQNLISNVYKPTGSTSNWPSQIVQNVANTVSSSNPLPLTSQSDASSSTVNYSQSSEMSKTPQANIDLHRLLSNINVGKTLSSQASQKPWSNQNSGRTWPSQSEQTWQPPRKDFQDEVVSVLHGSTTNQPGLEIREVFDYGHKSKGENTANQTSSEQGQPSGITVNSQQKTENNMQALTLQSISEIMKVAKSLQGIDEKRKQISDSENEQRNEQQRQNNVKHLKVNSVGEMLKNMSQSEGKQDANASWQLKSGNQQQAPWQPKPGNQQKAPWQPKPGNQQKAPWQPKSGNQQNKNQAGKDPGWYNPNQNKSSMSYGLDKGNPNLLTKQQKASSPFSESTEIYPSVEGSRYERKMRTDEQKSKPIGNPSITNNPNIQNKNSLNVQTQQKTGKLTIPSGPTSVPSTKLQPNHMKRTSPAWKKQNLGMQGIKKTKIGDGQTVSDLMTTSELQSWEELQRQLRQSYLEEQISGPSTSAYDQRLQQQTAPKKQQLQKGSLDWFQKSKLQVQGSNPGHSKPKSILKGQTEPNPASNIWAEEDLDFMSTLPPKQMAAWGQGVASYDYSKGAQGSNLVHYANSDSD